MKTLQKIDVNEFFEIYAFLSRGFFKYLHLIFLGAQKFVKFIN